jgi:hypothetical protein
VLLTALLAIALAVTSAGGDALRAAWLRGDRQDFGRVADRVGVRGLGEAIAHGARVQTLAAIAAAPLVDEAWMLLEPLGGRLADEDRPLAAGAARAAVAIVRALPLEEMIRRGAPADELADDAAGFAAIAARADLWPDVRVHALECALALGADVAPALLGDEDAEVRRAAIAFASADVAATASRLGELATHDGDPAVAAAAAAALCRAGAALPEPARAHLATLLADPPAAALVDPGDVSSLRRCASR